MSSQDLAGRAVYLVISSDIQDIVSAVDIGAAIWKLLKLAEKVDKKIRIGKHVARLLLCARTKTDITENGCGDDLLISRAKIFGPMTVDTTRTALFLRKPSNIDLVPYAYFMAIAIPIQHNRARTYWYIMRSDGCILASWTTQTFTSRLPDFLKPNEKLSVTR